MARGTSGPAWLAWLMGAASVGLASSPATAWMILVSFAFHAWACAFQVSTGALMGDLGRVWRWFLWFGLCALGTAWNLDQGPHAVERGWTLAWVALFAWSTLPLGAFGLAMLVTPTRRRVLARAAAARRRAV